LGSPLETHAAAIDLISFPQWLMLLGMECFAKRHHKMLNELLGTHVAKLPSDSAFGLLLAQLDEEGFGECSCSGRSLSLTLTILIMLEIVPQPCKYSSKTQNSPILL
jgi:hypothetical protein